MPKPKKFKIQKAKTHKSKLDSKQDHKLKPCHRWLFAFCLTRELIRLLHSTFILLQVLIKSGFTCGRLQQVRGGGKSATWSPREGKKNYTNAFTSL